jgi:hypothetical protein
MFSWVRYCYVKKIFAPEHVDMGSARTKLPYTVLFSGPRSVMWAFVGPCRLLQVNVYAEPAENILYCMFKVFFLIQVND